MRHLRSRLGALAAIAALACAVIAGMPLAAEDPPTDPPAITSPSSATAALGQPFAYQITATNAPQSFSASGLPAGLAVDTATGLISGTPTAQGDWNVAIGAANAAGARYKTLMVHVGPAPTVAPTITSPGTATATIALPFSYQITADQAPTAFAADGLPAGLGIDPLTGLVSGVPQALGTSTILLSATNAVGTGSAPLTLTVVAAAPPVVSTRSIGGTAGVPLACVIAATNAPTSFGASGLPAGLAIDAATGTIAGTPVAAGQTPVTVSASNAAGTGTAVVTIGIVQPTSGAPVITSPTTATATVGAQFVYAATATGAPTTFGASGLPSGLAMDAASGTISGVPVAAGTSAVTLVASNASGSTFTTMALIVVPAGTAAAPPPTTTSDLGGATQGCGLGSGVATLGGLGSLLLAMANLGRKRRAERIAR